MKKPLLELPVTVQSCALSVGEAPFFLMEKMEQMEKMKSKKKRKASKSDRLLMVENYSLTRSLTRLFLAFVSSCEILTALLLRVVCKTDSEKKRSKEKSDGTSQWQWQWGSEGASAEEVANHFSHSTTSEKQIQKSHSSEPACTRGY